MISQKVTGKGTKVAFEKVPSLLETNLANSEDVAKGSCARVISSRLRILFINGDVSIFLNLTIGLYYP